MDAPLPWLYSPRGLAVRLFLTCWFIYSLHFASNIVREIYPALGLGDRLSFRLDEYAGLHDDLFETEGYGWHSGNNPGVSMLAAVPYALWRPVIDRVVERVQQGRAVRDAAEPPTYSSPSPEAREFYREAWRRGLDVKFGLAAFVMQSWCMAPSSALAAVLMFFLLRCLLHSDRTALALAVLYAFGTPVFFRTGYLNHNLMLGHIAFAGFVALWNPGHLIRWSSRTRLLLGGLAGGTALLFDYSGLVLLVGLGLYAIVSRPAGSIGDVLRRGAWYGLGALAPVLLLWFYQWQSFGHPFYPGQHWMPPVEWSDLGYQGYVGPQLELLVALLFDYRFGLFVTSPLMLLALLAPLFDRGPSRALPRRELWWMLGIAAAFVLFFSGSSYVQLQYITGIRYLAALFPFLFVPVAVVLVRLPPLAAYIVGLLSLVESWCLAMYRDVERGLGVLDPILHVFSAGFQLPFLTVLSRMGDTYGDFFAAGVSPLPIFALAAAILYGIWGTRFYRHTRPRS